MYIPCPSYQRLQNEVFDRIIAEGCSILETSITNDQQLKASKVLMKAMAREISKLIEDSYKVIQNEIHSEELCSPAGSTTGEKEAEDTNDAIEEEEKKIWDVNDVRLQMIEWLNNCRYQKNWDDHIVVKDDSVRVYIYTHDHVYSIVGTVNNYLGCIASNRAPRPGEDWTRGSDLPDGKFCEKTWNAIMSDIVGYESLPVVRPIRKMNRFSDERYEPKKSNNPDQDNIDTKNFIKSFKKEMQRGINALKNSK